MYKHADQSSSNSIGYLLKRAQAALRLALDGVLEAHALTMPQYAALSALRERPGASNADLARASFVTPQTMIRILSLLETAKLIARVPHPVHGRILQVRLTASGERVLQRCDAVVRKVEAQMLGKLSAADKERLKALLTSCVAALEE
jgi:DNA-binding MarR family transcriptional regulator